MDSLDIADHSTTGARAGSATFALNHERVVDSRAGRVWEMLIAAFPATHRRKVSNRPVAQSALEGVLPRSRARRVILRRVAAARSSRLRSRAAALPPDRYSRGSAVRRL